MTPETRLNLKSLLEAHAETSITPQETSKVLDRLKAQSGTIADVKAIIARLQGILSGCDSLRRAPWKGKANPLAGHCYVGSEALYYLLGGAKSNWVPQAISHEGGPHWYLKNKISGEVVDPTASQFQTPVPYEQGKGKGFLTNVPSKRAQEVLRRYFELAERP
jgi:hypothetical protein